VTPLKTLRAELSELVADALGVSSIPVGAAINPPCVIVAPADPYLDVVTYCADGVNFEVFVCVGPGEDSARIDALDDMVDQVRVTLQSKSAGGFKFAYQGTDRPGFGISEFLGVTVRVRFERDLD
jgi:hypothetical protein